MTTLLDLFPLSPPPWLRFSQLQLYGTPSARILTATKLQSPSSIGMARTERTRRWAAAQSAQTNSWRYFDRFEVTGIVGLVRRDLDCSVKI